MTDLLDAPALDLEGTGDSLSLTEGDPCKCPDTHETAGGTCDLFLPEPHGKNRIRCEACQRDTGWLHKGTKAKKDTPPVNINVKLPSTTGPKSKLDESQRRVQEAATAWLGMLAGVLEIQGDTVCAEATKKCAPEIANQLAALSKFHPIIVKVLAPVEATGEALVWISLALAISPLILTVLTHHKVISDEAAARIGIVTAMGAVVGNAPQAPAEAA